MLTRGLFWNNFQSFGKSNQLLKRKLSEEPTQSNHQYRMNNFGTRLFPLKSSSFGITKHVDNIKLTRVITVTAAELDSIKDFFFLNSDYSGYIGLKHLIQLFENQGMIGDSPSEKSLAIIHEISSLQSDVNCNKNEIVSWKSFYERLLTKTNLELPVQTLDTRMGYYNLLKEQSISATLHVEPILRVLSSTFRDLRITSSRAAIDRQKLINNVNSQENFHRHHITSTLNYNEASSKIDERISNRERTESSLLSIDPTIESAKVVMDQDNQLEEESAIEELELIEKKLIAARFADLDSNELSRFIRVSSDYGNPDEVLIDKFNIRYCRVNIIRLQPKLWLNDESINFYMCMLQQRDNELCTAYPSRQPSHFFNSFFMERLLVSDKKYTYSNVQRWSKSFDVFTRHKIFFPINISNTHWTLAVIYMAAKEIHYYDSMAGLGHQYLTALRQWVVDESLNKKKIAIDVNDWKLISQEPHVPQQHNGYDCGVFTIVCSDFISDDLPLKYSQNDISNMRQKIGCDILRGSLSYPHIALRKN